MPIADLGLLLISIAMGATGQLLLKAGANKLGRLELTLPGFISAITNYHILIGLVFFGISFFLWLVVLTKHNLSFLYPMVSLNYVIIILASKVLFNEQLTVTKIIGAVIIIVGVIIINLNAASSTS